MSLDSLSVNNAGQVLASPYIPHLFATLRLTEDGKFKRSSDANKAVFLLQFMVGGSAGSPEQSLSLNKILCGIDPGTPIQRDGNLSNIEEDTVQSMLEVLIQHWGALGSPSVAGLQESFFQRQGILHLQEVSYHLRVERRTFDMLLDRIPWSYSVIKHPWMDRLLYVSWQ